MAKLVLQKNKPALCLFVDANIFTDTKDLSSTNHETAIEFLEAATVHHVPIYLASISIVFLAHTVGKFQSRGEIQKSINAILQHCHVLDVTLPIIQAANQTEQRDFEDAVQYFTALHHGNITHIITSVRHFPKLDIPVISPAQAIALIED
jgi:predicted nucleic acid-binding protein